MLGKRCRLCGGRLANNRCVLCGLDKNVYDRRTSASVNNGDLGTQDAQVAESVQETRRQNPHKAPWKPVMRQHPGDPTQRNISYIGVALLTVLIILGIVFFWVFLRDTVGNSSNDAEANSADAYATAEAGTENELDYSAGGEDGTDEVEDTYTDPYNYVSREISDEGDSWEAVLGNGTYMVGVHIPEGVYEVTLVEGSGVIEITDYDNVIFHFVSFGSETTDSSVVESDDDVRLYNGAILQVYSGVILRFSTENAQELEQELEENPLTESVTLEVGTYTADEDTIPEGIYDITITEDEDVDRTYASVTLIYPNGRYEYIWVETAAYTPVSDEYDEVGAKNIVIPEGTEVLVEYGGITLTPSEDYYEVDYTIYTED